MQTSEELSPVLFMAEDPTHPNSTMAAAHLTAAVEAVRSVGAVTKVCNPAISRIVSRPVCAGVEEPTDEHWESVARALLLTPQQMQDAALLNDLRKRWLTRMHKDQASLHHALREVLFDACNQWKVSLSWQLLVRTGWRIPSCVSRITYQQWNHLATA